MIRKISLAAFIAIQAICFPHLAFSQTYLGVLSVPANTGPGGSCCTKAAIIDQDSAGVPSDGSCAGCSVITQQQWAAFAAGTAKARLVCAPNSVTSDTTNILVCTPAGDQVSKYPLTVLGVPVIVKTPPPIKGGK